MIGAHRRIKLLGTVLHSEAARRVNTWMLYSGRMVGGDVREVKEPIYASN